MFRLPARSTLFPTRRSSDLEIASFLIVSPPFIELRKSCTLADEITSAPGCVPAYAGPAFVDTLRSEEHTSELQSRRDLVCRLLLEKKKSILRNAPFTISN